MKVPEGLVVINPASPNVSRNLYMVGRGICRDFAKLEAVAVCGFRHMASTTSRIRLGAVRFAFSVMVFCATLPRFQFCLDVTATDVSSRRSCAAPASSRWNGPVRAGLRPARRVADWPTSAPADALHSLRGTWGRAGDGGGAQPAGRNRKPIPAAGMHTTRASSTHGGGSRASVRDCPGRASSLLAG